jgi:hypothetical protein
MPVVIPVYLRRYHTLSSRFRRKSFLRWGGILALIIMLISNLVFPSSFGIPPSFLYWRLAFNFVLLVCWIVVSGYSGKANSPFSFTFQPASIRQAFLIEIAGMIVIALIFTIETLTNGMPLEAAVKLGLSVGLSFGIVRMSKTFLYWRRQRRTK